MSLTLRSFALRVCYFLGYYKERVDKLKNQIAILQIQNALLGSTEALYVQYCDIVGCKNWCIDGYDSDRIHQEDHHLILCCEDCGIHICQNHAREQSWISIPLNNSNDETICFVCQEKRDK